MFRIVPSYAQFKAIIDVEDKDECYWHPSNYYDNGDGKNNTCRNVVTLQEILRGTGADDTDVPHSGDVPATGKFTKGSAALREQCLRDALGCWNAEGTAEDIGDCVRGWKKTETTTSQSNGD